jgi:hypothetical protein
VRALRGCLVLAVLASAPDTIHAQTSLLRRGLRAGVSAGLGDTSPDLCVGCGTGLTVGAHLGAMLTPQVAVMAEGLATAAAPNVLSKMRGRHNGLFAMVQYWPSDRFWLKGGAGVGSVEREDPPRYDYATTHLAGLAGVGFEVNPRSRFVLEIALLDYFSGDSPARFPSEAPHRSYANTLALTARVTWHQH